MQKIEGVPDGWELVRIGYANAGETIINSIGKPSQIYTNLTEKNYVIVRKIPKWRPAKPSDLDNGPVKARFRDIHSQDWIDGFFDGYVVGENCVLKFRRNRGDGKWWEWTQFCEVQDNA